MTECNILIASGGRRPYLVRWFREALELNGTSGKVILADHDTLSPAGALADEYVWAPLVSDTAYDSWLDETLHKHDISLAISVNDYELSRWASLPADAPEYAPLVRLSHGMQDTIEDKLTTSNLLELNGVRGPVTLLANDALKLTSRQLAWLLGTDEIVVKGRYGSGSKGLHFATAEDLRLAVTRARDEVTHQDGTMPENAETAEELIVVQPRIRGEEFGLDVVANLAGKHVGTLARQKLAMRSGETDRAVTASIQRFWQLGERITQVVHHRGLIDVDLIRDEDGDQWVIDINPRFGGGYPFSHLGGAHVPAAYVAWVLGRMHDHAWVVSRPSVVGAKCVDIVPVTAPVPQPAPGPQSVSGSKFEPARVEGRDHATSRAKEATA